MRIVLLKYIYSNYKLIEGQLVLLSVRAIFQNNTYN